MTVFLCVLLICITIVLMQQMHYEYLLSRQEQGQAESLISHLEQKLKDVETLKSKVDSLVLRAGFKL